MLEGELYLDLFYCNVINRSYEKKIDEHASDKNRKTHTMNIPFTIAYTHTQFILIIVAICDKFKTDASVREQLY